MGGAHLAQLIVRNLDKGIVHALKIRAVHHGRSAEAEHREILREALLGRKPSMNLKAWLLDIPPVGEDSDFERTPDFGRQVDL